MAVNQTRGFTTNLVCLPHSKNKADLTISTYINVYCKINLFNCVDDSLESQMNYICIDFVICSTMPLQYLLC